MMNENINIEEIENILRSNSVPDDGELDDILNRALCYENDKAESPCLSMQDVSKLLNCQNEEQHQRILEAAFKVKKKVFGDRIVLFAPLYISSYCSNNCLYCGFRRENKHAKRIKLSTEEAVEQALILEKKGFKRVLLVTGEDPSRTPVSYINDVVKSIYDNTGIRIIHLNAPPMSVNYLRRIRDTGVGVFQSFQETYHPETYKIMHPSGIKASYNFRLETMDRALTSGFKDVGIGVLLGLYNYKFEVLALMQHSYYLLKKFGTYPHTVSVPRLRPASGAIINDTPHIVSDIEFERIVAVYRLALPVTGIVITTRESSSFRDKLLTCGISQMSAGSKTDPGGYAKDDDNLDTKQFSIHDKRSLEEILQSIVESDQIPSFCTTCYRVGRIGSKFKNIAQSGRIKNFCALNAILTLKEYLINHNGSDSSDCLEKIIERRIERVEPDKVKEDLIKKMKALEDGEKDLYY